MILHEQLSNMHVPSTEPLWVESSRLQGVPVVAVVEEVSDDVKVIASDTHTTDATSGRDSKLPAALSLGRVRRRWKVRRVKAPEKFLPKMKMIR